MMNNMNFSSLFYNIETSLNSKYLYSKSSSCIYAFTKNNKNDELIKSNDKKPIGDYKFDRLSKLDETFEFIPYLKNTRNISLELSYYNEDYNDVTHQPCIECEGEGIVTIFGETDYHNYQSDVECESCDGLGYVEITDSIQLGITYKLKTIDDSFEGIYFSLNNNFANVIKFLITYGKDDLFVGYDLKKDRNNTIVFKYYDIYIVISKNGYIL